MNYTPFFAAVQGQSSINIHYNEIKHVGTENFISAIFPRAQGAILYFPTHRRSR
jgi:hypothetical protein